MEKISMTLKEADQLVVMKKKDNKCQTITVAAYKIGKGGFPLLEKLELGSKQGNSF